MNCFMCKGRMEDKKVNHIVDLGNCIIIIKNVPGLVCKQCGEVYFENEIVKNIEAIAKGLRKVITEIAVVNYTDKVA